MARFDSMKIHSEPPLQFGKIIKGHIHQSGALDEVPPVKKRLLGEKALTEQEIFKGGVVERTGSLFPPHPIDVQNIAVDQIRLRVFPEGSNNPVNRLLRVAVIGV